MSNKIIGFKCRFCGLDIELADNPVTGFIDTWRDVEMGDPNCIENEVGDIPIHVKDYYSVVVTGLHEPIPVVETDSSSD